MILNGKLASSGKKNEIIFEQALELYTNRNDKNKNLLIRYDFDISFARGLSLEDGAATLTDFTASIISEESFIFLKINDEKEIIFYLWRRKKK